MFMVCYLPVEALMADNRLALRSTGNYDYIFIAKV